MSHQVPTYTAEQIRQAEVPLLEAGVPLMARASGALAQVALEELSAGQRVLVVAGPGNNGGDALYAGAEIAQAGYSVDLLPVAERWHEGGMAAALAAGCEAVTLADVQAAPEYDLVLDGILGTGTAANPALRGTALAAVEALGPDQRVIAVDVPSGTHPDTGAAGGPVLQPAITVTFGGVKQGLVNVPGEVVLVRIGLEEELESLPAAGHATVSRVLDARPPAET